MATSKSAVHCSWAACPQSLVPTSVSSGQNCWRAVGRSEECAQEFAPQRHIHSGLIQQDLVSSDVFLAHSDQYADGRWWFGSPCQGCQSGLSVGHIHCLSVSRLIPASVSEGSRLITTAVLPSHTPPLWSGGKTSASRVADRGSIPALAVGFSLVESHYRDFSTGAPVAAPPGA